MVRVLHITPSMNRGGIETFLMNLYRNIDRSKLQFDFLLNSDGEDLYSDEIRSLGGRIYSIPSRSIGYYKNKKALINYFKVHKEYSIVHQHLSSLSYIEPLVLARKFDIPYRIVHSHNTKQSGSKVHKALHKFNQMRIHKIATHFFACSKLAAKWLYTSRQFNDNDYVVINNAIKTSDFSYNNKIRQNKRDELGIEKDEILVGHIGRFNLQKNHDLIIDIFKSYLDNYGKAKLLLVGDGPLMSKILNKVADLGISNCVIFAGVRKDISELLQAIDVFLMPSLHEGLPVTLVEAQSAGVPCVLADTITKEIDIYKNIWCSLEDLPCLWANKINDLHLLKREDTSNLVANAGFDISVVAGELQRFYISLDRKWG